MFPSKRQEIPLSSLLFIEYTEEFAAVYQERFLTEAPDGRPRHKQRLGGLLAAWSVHAGEQGPSLPDSAAGARWDEQWMNHEQWIILDFWGHFQTDLTSEFLYVSTGDMCSLTRQ